MKKRLAAIPVFLALAGLAFAQRPARPDSAKNRPVYRAAPVIVTALRVARPLQETPHAIQAVSTREIQRARPGLSLEKALRFVPGVQVQVRHNFAQGDRIAVRGVGSRAPFGVRGIKLLLDDVPLTLPDGQTQLNNIDLGSAGSIEVLRGPGALYYGNAAGGAIVIRTELPSQGRALHVRPRLFFGSYGLRKQQFELSGAFHGTGLLLSLHRTRIAGFRQHAAAQFSGANFLGRTPLSETVTLRTVANWFDAPYLLNPSSLSREQMADNPRMARTFIQNQGAGKKIRQVQAGATLQYRSENGTRASATLYGISRSLFNAIPGRVIDLDRRGWGLRSIVHGQIAAGPFLIQPSAGFDYEAQIDDRQEFENNGVPAARRGRLAPNEILGSVQQGARLLDQREHVRGTGLFGELSIRYTSALIFSLGGRGDRYLFAATDRFFEDGSDASGDRQMLQFSPMAGVVLRLGEAVSLYLNYSTAFQTPTTTELGNTPGGAGGFNQHLSPERIRSVEAGVKGLWPQAEISLSVFRFRLEDMLIPFQTRTGASEEIFFRNAGKTRNTGLELSVRWQPAASLTLDGNYTLMNFIFRDFTVQRTVLDSTVLVPLSGKKIPAVAPQRVFAHMRWERTGGLFAETDVQWIDAYPASDVNGPAPGEAGSRDSYFARASTRVDVRAGLRHRVAGTAVELFIAVENLLDSDYAGSVVPNARGNRFFEPAPGRTLLFGAELVLQIK